MKLGAVGWVAAIVLAMGCGPDPVAQEELEEVCGEAGPFRVLELEPDQRIAAVRSLRIADRRVFVVHRVAADDTSSIPSWSDPEVWSTGLCGESPVQLSSDIEKIFTNERWPDVLLGCKQETGEVFELDPLGVRAPHLVFAGDPAAVGCALRWSDHGLLSVVPHDDDFGALMLSPYPEDPRTQTSEPVTLLDPVRITENGTGGTGMIAGSIRTFADSVLALDGKDTLVRVDLADRSVTTLQEEVREIDASFDGRYVMWQDMAVTRESDWATEGKVFLRDLTAGGDALLGETSLTYSLNPLGYAGGGIVQLDFPSAPMQRIFFLPGLESIPAPSDLVINTKLDDGRWLVSSRSDNFFYWYDLREGTREQLFSRPADLVWFESDALVLFETEKQCCDERDEGPLWRVPFDGEPEQLAERGNRSMRLLPDGRIIGPVGIGSDGVGRLVVIDPSTGEERRVDDRVDGRSVDTRWFEDEGLISYSVSDGERSGVYLARLSQHERSGARKAVVREGHAIDVGRGAEGERVPVIRSLTTGGEREARARAE
ncbi:hypothetical protein [Nannocystis sp. SCPEA4]|uniref:hypothetical protein n=1 Tax=Nannocystis sp. SCPEA4 TaxID=2996787 RepID=UPI002270CD38|nr:hypothetical protein [Nannocystis sp. SCPEA4]MCY1057024.1 hypothetical protein [Nannocystis sp. SCPEA4]